MFTSRLLPYSLVIALFSTTAACALDLDERSSSDELALQAEIMEDSDECSDDSHCGELAFCNLSPRTGALSCEVDEGEPERDPGENEEVIPVDLDNCQGPTGLAYWPEYRDRREVLSEYSESEFIEDSGRYEGASTRKQPVKVGQKATFNETLCTTEGGGVTVNSGITLSSGVSVGPFSAGAGTSFSTSEAKEFKSCRTQGSVTYVEGHSAPQYCTAFDGLWTEDYEVTNKRDVREWREARMCRKCRVTSAHLCCQKRCGPWAGITGSETRDTETVDVSTMSVSEPISGTFCRSNQYPPAPLTQNGEAWE